MATVSFPAAAADPTQFGPTDAHGGDPALPPVDQPAARTGRQAGQDRPERQPIELSEALIAVARAAAGLDAETAERVGEYLGATAEDDVAVSAAFASADRGYRGWYWSVTLAVIDPAQPTVSEVVLLPGDEALLAPAWVPWDQRIRPGDVGAGDLLPTPADDIRLVPSYVDSADPALAELAYEFGFGRSRVLSREGRDEAAQRWHDSYGPDSPIAVGAQAHCVTCGFYLPLAGLLGQALGACGNEFSPADGRVVDAEFGCGAHSDTVIDAPLISASTETVIDELTLEVHYRPAPAGAEWDSQVQDAATEDVMVESLTDAAEISTGVIDLADIDALESSAAIGNTDEVTNPGPVVESAGDDVDAVIVARADADAFAAAVEQIADAAAPAALTEVIVVDSIGDAVVGSDIAVEAAAAVEPATPEPVPDDSAFDDTASNDAVT